MPTGSRPAVIYVSYDGAAEPLGRSQVLSYLIRLASDCDITLISFEKAHDGEAALRSELSAAGIRWVPLTYHRRPPVVSTLRDVLSGVRALRETAARRRPDIVHVRSDVPALMALMARRWTGGKLLFDIRGFWADERVEGGIWTPGGGLYRLARWCEDKFYATAAGIVTLTEASLPQIERWSGPSPVVKVIPTCVDLERFALQPRRPDGSRAIWSGSIGTWYRFDLAARVSEALAMPLTVITRQPELALAELDGYPASVASLSPEQVPGELHAGDVGLCLIKSSFSKTASAPTRFAEYLACGMPVIVTPGVGDLEAIVERHQVGVVLRAEDGPAIRAAADALRELAGDPSTPGRCRQVAHDLFDVRIGARGYLGLYRSLQGERRAPGPSPNPEVG